MVVGVVLPVVVVYSGALDLAASSALVHLAQTVVLLEHVVDLVVACLVGVADLARFVVVGLQSVLESVEPVAGMLVAPHLTRAV